MFYNLSRTTPPYFSKNRLSFESSLKTTSNGSLEDHPTETISIVQKTNNTSREHFNKACGQILSKLQSTSPRGLEERKILKKDTTLIKICGTKEYWISLKDLESQSKFFERMFAYNWKESTTHELKIEHEKGKDSNEADQFIQCLENRSSQCINEKNYQELLSLAHRYEVPWLVNDCEQFLISNLTVDNVLSAIKDIAEPYCLSKLSRACFIYLFNSRKQCLLDADFMKEMQTLDEKLRLVELKILTQIHRHYVLISKNPSYLFDVTIDGRTFERDLKPLMQIFSGESINKPSINLRITGLSSLPSLAEFLKSNPKLASLELKYSGKLEEADVIQVAALLKEHKIVTDLNLNYTNLGDAGVTQIAEALKENKTLTRLNIGSNDIRDVTPIAAMLKENKTLTTLDLRGNRIEDAGVTQIAEALKENKTLTTLDLVNNRIGGAGAILIAAILKENKTLTSLHLRGNQIEDEGITQIAAALETNKTLRRLDLGVTLEGTGAIQIAAALKENKTLTSLDFSFNIIGDAGAIPIADALKKNTTLTELNLGRNKIGDEGAIQIAAVLKENKTLTNLNLAGNYIRDKGVTRISEALKENTTVRNLDLNQNKIGDAGAIQLGEALKKNNTLTTLDLQFNKIGDIGATLIMEARKENTTLTSLDLCCNHFDHKKIGNIPDSEIKAALLLINLKQMLNNFLSLISTVE
jgi:Ran GTPase-activating protein (RanGAP) involved in mRNA processing and transport